MSERFGLQLEVIERIQAVLESFEEIDTVLLYGSRAKGNHRNGSDVDLTIKTFSGVPVRGNLVFRVTDAIDELNLIYTFDISLFDHIQQDDLLDHISRVGEIFYQRVCTQHDK